MKKISYILIFILIIGTLTSCQNNKEDENLSSIETKSPTVEEPSLPVDEEPTDLDQDTSEDTVETPTNDNEEEQIDENTEVENNDTEEEGEKEENTAEDTVSTDEEAEKETVFTSIPFAYMSEEAQDVADNLDYYLRLYTGYMYFYDTGENPKAGTLYNKVNEINDEKGYEAAEEWYNDFLDKCDELHGQLDVFYNNYTVASKMFYSTTQYALKYAMFGDEIIIEAKSADISDELNLREAFLSYVEENNIVVDSLTLPDALVEYELRHNPVRMRYTYTIKGTVDGREFQQDVTQDFFYDYQRKDDKTYLTLVGISDIIE